MSLRGGAERRRSNLLVEQGIASGKEQERPRNDITETKVTVTLEDTVGEHRKSSKIDGGGDHVFESTTTMADAR